MAISRYKPLAYLQTLPGKDSVRGHIWVCCIILTFNNLHTMCNVKMHCCTKYAHDSWVTPQTTMLDQAVLCTWVAYGQDSWPKNVQYNKSYDSAESDNMSNTCLNNAPNERYHHTHDFCHQCACMRFTVFVGGFVT